MRSSFQNRLDEAIAHYTAAEREEDFQAALMAIETIRAEAEVHASLVKHGSITRRVPDEPLDFSALPEADFLELLCGEPIEREVLVVELPASAPPMQQDAASA